jgi:hypothetical protein
VEPAGAPPGVAPEVLQLKRMQELWTQRNRELRGCLRDFRHHCLDVLIMVDDAREDPVGEDAIAETDVHGCTMTAR